MLDKSLIRIINNGRCFVLIGSGPSCEVGYPSWQRLAELTYKELENKGIVLDSASYKKFLENNEYPEFFKLAECDLGDRNVLVNLIRSLLTPPSKDQGVLYELISSWPFSCYLTTNYDDEIVTHLSSLKEHFVVLRNNQKDFYSMRDGASHFIQKLHSDLDHPDEVILTSSDYNRFYIEDAGRYFRDKLRQVFEMFDIFIIGHSLMDPDIKYVLQMARKTAGPLHPIYMAAADFTKADEQEYQEKYNIVLIRYSNSDGTHSELRRMLKTADRYIVPRNSRSEKEKTTEISKEEVESAAALFLYRRLNEVQITANLSPFILTGLFLSDAGELSKEELVTLPSLKTFSRTGVAFVEALEESLQSLVKQGLVSEVDGKYVISKSGGERVKKYQAIRETEKDRAYGQFCLNLKNGYSDITEEQLQKCRQFAERVIITCFASRGLTIANQVFADQSTSHEELSDIFGHVTDMACKLDGMELKATFVEAMHMFLVEPNLPQKEYLASISQGFFLYHLLGLDPKCSQLRRDVFQSTLWICDSSVLLPLAAAGCHNHEYASELFQLLTDAKAELFTTPNLLQEAWEHFQWASNFIRKNGVESSEFLRASLVIGSYSQNLFLDGYIRLSAEGQIGSYKDYLKLILPQGIDKSSFEAQITKAGVHVMDISDIDGFVQEDIEEIEEAKILIQKKRQESGTYRSELQIISEAEVWVFLENLRSGKYSLPGLNDKLESVYFISKSRVLDRVFNPKTVSTWSQEAIYRYVTALPGKEIIPDLLQQCMLHEYAVISFIDKDRYIRYFGPSINTAKLSYKNERTKYISEIEDTHAGQLDKAFELTPDLEKPFFVSQMGWKLAEASRRGEKLAMQRTKEAEAKVKKLESEKDQAWKTREKRRKEHEEGRLRNIKDPKHLSKRRKQAKKRKKKGK